MNRSNSSKPFSNLTESFDMTRVDFPQFVIYIVIQFLLLAVEVYILSAFIFFFKMKRKSAYLQSGRRRISRERKILIALLMFVAVIGVLRAAQFLHLLFLPNYSHASAQACSLNLNIFYVLYIAGLAALYIFLWFRQHTLYALPTLQRLVHRSMKQFSDSLLALIVFTAVAASVTFVLANPTEKITYVPQTHTCLFPSPSESKVYVVNFAAYAILIFFQISLLVCFVYILRRHQANMRRHRTVESDDSNVDSPRSLQRLIRNCAKVATVCMVTDVTTLLISFFLPPTAQLYNLVLFDIDYIINQSCAIACFAVWKEMIDPWALRGKINCNCLCMKRIENFWNASSSNPPHSHPTSVNLHITSHGNHTKLTTASNKPEEVK